MTGLCVVTEGSCGHKASEGEEKEGSRTGGQQGTAESTVVGRGSGPPVSSLPHFSGWAASEPHPLHSSPGSCQSNFPAPISWNRVFSNSFNRVQRDQQAPEATTQNGDCTPHSSPWRNSLQIQPRRPSTRTLVPSALASALNMGTRRFPALPLVTSSVWAGAGACPSWAWSFQGETVSSVFCQTKRDTLLVTHQVPLS